MKSPLKPPSLRPILAAGAAVLSLGAAVIAPAPAQAQFGFGSGNPALSGYKHEQGIFCDGNENGAGKPAPL